MIIILQVVCSYDESLSFYESYRGPDAAVWFMSRMKCVVDLIDNFYKNSKPLVTTPEEQSNFEKAVLCHICNKTLENDRVRDHCHLTGEIIKLK